MADPRERLSELSRRVQGSADDGSLASERAVQLRAAEPLIEVLGWDVRGDEVHPETTLGGHDVDYLLTIEDQPAVAVVTESPEGDLDRTAEELLRPLLEAGRAPRGLATDGRRVVLLVADDERAYGHAFAFGDAENNTDALDRFHRSTLEAEIGEARDRQRAVARSLLEQREAVTSAIEDEVLAVTGADVSDTVAREASRFVDELVAELAPEGDDVEARRGASVETDTDTDEAIGDENADPASATGSPPVTDREPPDEDGSYVARFFGGSSSVGAVGTASPRATTVGVVRYLLENQELRRAVTFPWELEDGVPVVAEHRPAPEWIALEHPDSTDVFVRPIDDPATAEAAIDGLAEAVGLRVMFQGDW